MASARGPLITNLAAFLEDSRLTTGVSRSARKLGQHLAGIVEAATSHRAGALISTAVPCRLRTGRQPCPGSMDIQRTEVPAEIVWRCSACGDNGVVSGWEEFECDLRAEAISKEQLTEVRLARDQFAVLRSDLSSYRTLTRLLASATREGADVLLCGTSSEVTYLGDEVSAKANLARDPHRRTLLLDASSIIDGALLGGPTEAAAPDCSSVPSVSHIEDLLERSVPGLRDSLPPELIRKAAENTVESARLCQCIEDVLSIPREEPPDLRVLLRTLDDTLDAITRFAARSPMSALDAYLHLLQSIPRLTGLVDAGEPEMVKFCRRLCGAALFNSASERLSIYGVRDVVSAMAAQFYTDSNQWFAFVPDAVRDLELGKRDRAWYMKMVAALPGKGDRRPDQVRALLDAVACE